jgi:hypothetical protein
MPGVTCQKCKAVSGTASMKCPLCGQLTRLGCFRHRLLRVRWYALLIVVLGFVVLSVARGEPGRFLGLLSMLAGCGVYVIARFVDQRIRG